MKITKAIESVFSDCKLQNIHWYSTTGAQSGYNVYIDIKNKWGACIVINDYSITFQNYHGPCESLNIQMLDVNSKSEMLFLRNLIEDYLDLMYKVEDIKHISKDMKQYIREKKLNSII